MQNKENYIKQLQDQLKKQGLLIERQHREKMKIKKQIETSIQEYYSLVIQKNKLGHVLPEDGLGNNYNFVKDLVLSISKDVVSGMEILLLTEVDIISDMSGFFFSIIYDSFTQTDPYHKKMIKLALLLSDKICEKLNSINTNKPQQIKIENLPLKLRLILNQFMKQQSINQYFQMLGNKVLNQIPVFFTSGNAKGIKSWGSVIPTEEQYIRPQLIPTNSMSQQNLNGSFISVTQFQAEQQIEVIVNQYINDIVLKSELLPLDIKILINRLKKNLKFSQQTKYNIIWSIIFPQYLKNLNIYAEAKKWNNSIGVNFRQILQRIITHIGEKIKSKAILSKIIQKASYINQNKLCENRENEDKIMINGGCISYRQLYLLLQTIKENQIKLKPLNQRIANRIKKIHDISPNFEQFKSFPNPSTSYIVLIQIQYGNLIDKDYFKLYNQIYQNQMIKNMMKQILSSSDFTYITYSQSDLNFKETLLKIIQTSQIHESLSLSGAVNSSTEFILKIKYLVYLMAKQSIDQPSIVRQLILECFQRQKQFISIFQKTKLYLLQSLTTVHKSKKIIIVKNQSMKTIERQLKLIRILDQMEISLCITSPSTRAQNYKYIKSDSNGIIIENQCDCCHKQDIMEGLKCHVHSIIDAIQIFCNLKQVKQAINTGKDFVGIYNAFYKIAQSVKENFKNNYSLNIQEYNYFEKSIFRIMLRVVHEKLMPGKQKMSKDLYFEEKAKELSFISPQKIKVGGRENLDELEQIWQIASRYLKNFLNTKKTPQDKIEILKEVFQILKMAFQKFMNRQAKVSNQTIEVMMAYVLIRCKPEKLISNINYIQLFLPKNMLLKREGAILQRIKNATSLVLEGRIQEYLMLQDSKYKQQLSEAVTENYISNVKSNQKKISSMTYV